MWAFSLNFHFQLFFSSWCESQATWTKGLGFVMHFLSWQSGSAHVRKRMDKSFQILLSVNPCANWPKGGLLSHIVDGNKAYITALWCKMSFFLHSGWVLQMMSLHPARERVLELAGNLENGTSAAGKEWAGECLRRGKKMKLRISLASQASKLARWSPLRGREKAVQHHNHLFSEEVFYKSFQFLYQAGRLLLPS